MTEFARSYRAYRGLHPSIMFSATGVKWSTNQLRTVYRFPPDATGKGQLIVCIELGGGHSQDDFNTFRASQGLPPKQLQLFSVMGATSQPSTPDSADGEVMLDIEVASGCAPDADIAIVYAPNTLDGFVAGMAKAISLGITSCSWGQAEGTDPSSVSFENQMNGVLKPNAVLADGVTWNPNGRSVNAACGDNGSSDGVGVGDHVDFFSSSPYATGCGATSMPAATATGRQEVVWNNGASGGATGGGLSAIYNRPVYQNNIGLPSGNRRCVPDWAAVGDPQTGIYVLVDGQWMVIGGTSAVSPFASAVVACLNQKLGRNLGFLNPALYKLFGTPAYALCFQDITSGNNGTYKAQVGPDCCSGLGSPNVDQLAIEWAKPGNGGGNGSPPPPPPTGAQISLNRPVAAGTYNLVQV